MLSPVFERFLLLKVLEGIVLYGMDEGLWNRMYREFSEDFDQDQAEDKVDGKFLSLDKVILLSLTYGKWRVSSIPRKLSCCLLQVYILQVYIY